MLDRLLQRLPDLELATDEPLSSFLSGVETMPVRFTPAPPVPAR
jgi:cytochrome P450 family 142 subfamily A polypeptide 1